MVEPVKVLAVVYQMHLGGLESRLMDIIRKIDYSRVKLDVFTYRLHKGRLDDEILEYGGRIYYNPPLTPQNMFWYVRYFRDFLKNHPEYKIVHAHQDAWCSVFCKGAYLAGVPVRIAHSRTAVSTFSFSNLMKNVIKLPAARYATHYFAVSKLAGIWLFGEKAVQEGKVQIWKNAIDCKAFRYDRDRRSKVREELGIADKKVIIHVGNFTPPKNQDFLLEIMKKLLVYHSDYYLLFAGGETEAGLQAKAREKAESLGISQNVNFLGSRNDISDLLQAADVFCFPSLFEGLPGAVLEAQAAGLPCIISASITEEVKVLETTKMISLKEKADAWAGEIKKSLNAERRDTFEKMAHAGFDIEKLVIDLTNFYETTGRETNAIRQNR